MDASIRDSKVQLSFGEQSREFRIAPSIRSTIAFHHIQRTTGFLLPSVEGMSGSRLPLAELNGEARLMFDKKTVFIVGAGASCELGLPAGNGLMTKIASAVAPNQSNWGFANDDIQRVIVTREQRAYGHNWGGAIARFRTAAVKLHKALPYARSIDTYLDSQQYDEDVVFLGKLAIAQTILQAERESHLYRGREQSVSVGKQGKLDKSWYPPLSRLLTSGHRANDLSTLFANVSFIVFNYDRCLEVFLHRMVKDYFDASDEEAAQAMRSATIVHAYGQVGYMPWQRTSNDQPISTPLGGGDAPNLEEIANGIKTYSESADSNTKAVISQLTEQAEAMIFMGFGFIAQNMRLLAPAGEPAVERIIATAYKLSSQDREALQKKLERSFGVPVRGTRLQDLNTTKARYQLIFEPETCRSLMDNNIFSMADQ
jgi:hypothetical protein